VIGIVAVAVALIEQRNRDDTDSVDDPAGIRYEVPTDWEADAIQAPLVVFEVDGARTVTTTHRPTDDSEVADQLADGVDRVVCDDQPFSRPGIDGADQVAECTNTSPDLPRRAIGAIANGELWVITVEQTTDVDDGDAFIDSIEFKPPG
jgi:exopolysaccharide biosynthesis protein